MHRPKVTDSSHSLHLGGTAGGSGSPESPDGAEKHRKTSKACPSAQLGWKKPRSPRRSLGIRGHQLVPGLARQSHREALQAMVLNNKEETLDTRPPSGPSP